VTAAACRIRGPIEIVSFEYDNRILHPRVVKAMTVDSFTVPRERWYEHAELCRRVLAEWDKIEPYKARDVIAEWPA
jgi:hypothetical protein